MAKTNDMDLILFSAESPFNTLGSCAIMAALRPFGPCRKKLSSLNNQQNFLVLSGFV